jgi:hypothetical protein
MLDISERDEYGLALDALLNQYQSSADKVFEREYVETEARSTA